MDQPLTRWACDECGLSIEQPRDGYVLWSRGDHGYHSFKIIHQGRCDRDRQEYSAALIDFLGADGLAKLTALMSDGIVRQTLGASPRDRRIGDMDQFVDFLRRVQIPYYEEARRRYLDLDGAQEFSDAGETLPYLQRSLTHVAQEEAETD